jgi:hypothetical protein
MEGSAVAVAPGKEAGTTPGKESWAEGPAPRTAGIVGSVFAVEGSSMEREAAKRPAGATAFQAKTAASSRRAVSLMP